MTSSRSFADFRVGDRVYCLAWIGQGFDVVATNDATEMVTIQTVAGAPTIGHIDIFPETQFMLTHEPWDQIWYWPDRAGDHYLDVFERFADSHAVGDVVAGYVVGDGLNAAASQMTVRIDPSTSMMFRIEEINKPWGRVRVQPVAAISTGGALLTSPGAGPDANWLRTGPPVPLRLEMRLYRWCLSFGEFVLNFEDLHTGHLTIEAQNNPIR